MSKSGKNWGGVKDMKIYCMVRANPVVPVIIRLKSFKRL